MTATQQQAIVSPIPYFKQEGFTLFQADCLTLMRQWHDEQFDLIFADPPYKLSNDGFSVHAGKRVSVNKGQWDKSKGVVEDFEFHLAWIKECHRLLKPKGTIWISGTYHSIYQCGYALQLSGYHILNDIAWFKPNASPNLSCRFFTASHETLIWARKFKDAKHYFDYESMKNGNWPEDSLKKPNLQMRSVWSIHPPKAEEKTFGKHPTQKPLPLLRRIMLAATPEGGTVLDPFNGGGTTGLAAQALNRHYFGIDISAEYLDLTKKRLQQQNERQQPCEAVD